MEKSKSSLLSSSMLCVRQMVLRVGFKFKLATARVRTPRPSRLLMALLAGCGVQVALALPQGGQVAAGNVSIGAPAGNTLNITQTSDKGIINWQTFNVGSGEKVNFQQPGATSSTLNRVVGSDPSAIFGQINANGQVFLINNSGVLFAPGAQVNAAGLVASTLQLADSDYLAGNYALSGAGGGVSNQGVLKAGFVVLAGAQVSNTGTIVADGGTAALAAGDRVTLNLIGSDLVSMSVDAPAVAALVHAGGVVQADGGKVLITAKAADALLGSVVNVDGIVQAHAIGSRNGVITLDGGRSGVVAVSGTLDASGTGAGQTGGAVTVAGANVGLFDHATVDVNGDAGGGLVRIGGDWHGAHGDGDANASQVFVGQNASIHANALGTGNGGNVVLWSDDHTQFHGAIDARGGVDGGNGGAVETSSHDRLQASGRVDASAAKGTGGSWLLDPTEILITAASTSGVSETSNVWSNSTTPSQLDGAALSGSINSNTAVTVQTAGGGDIVVDAQITATPTSTGTLNLNAGGAIAFTSNGSVIVSNNATKGLNLNLNAAGGGISMNTASFINTGNAGNVTLVANGAVHLSKITTSGNLSVTSNGGAVDQETSTSKSLSVDGTTTVNAGAAAVTLNNTNNQFIADVSVNNSGANNVSIVNNGPLILGASSLGSGLFTANTAAGGGGAITQTGAITQASGAAGASFSSGTHRIILDDAANDFTGAVSLSNSGNHDVTLVDVGNLALGTVSIGSGINTISAGTAAGSTLSRGAALTATTAPLLSVGGAAPSASVATFFIGGAATGVSIADVGGGTAQNVTASGVQVLPALTVSGDLTVNAGGPLSQAGSTALVVTGLTTVNGGANGINLSHSGNTFTGGLSVNNSGANDVTIGTSSALSLAGSTLGSGALTVVTNNNAISQTGGITQASGGGAVLFNAGTSNANLGHGANDFTGVVSITATGSGVTTLRDANSVTLGTINIGSGANTFAVGAGGTLTRTSAITTGSNISLDIGTHTVDTTVRDYFTTGSLTGTGANIALTASGASAVDVAATGATVLPPLQVSGNLTITAGGDLSQSSPTAQIGVSGTTTINAGAHAVDLSNLVNHLGTSLAITGTGNHNIAIGNNDDLSLGRLDLGSGTLAITADGAISQTDTITQAASAGTATFTTTAVNGGNPITLTQNNDFTGAVRLNNVGNTNVAINDINALQLGTSNLGSGTLTVNAGGDITQTGAITQSASAGLATFTAGAHAITLTQGNDFTGDLALGNSGSNAVAVNDVNALSLGAVSVGSGTLDIVSHGALSQSGGNTIVQSGAGAVTLNANAGTIALANGNTLRGAVGLNNSGANNVALTNASALTLGPSALGTGTLTVNATGAITQAGDIAAGGTSSFNAGSANVTLGRTGNTFGGAVSATGASVTIAATGALQANATLTSGAGNLALSATGALTVPAGAITTSGDISLSSGAALTTNGALSGRDISLTGTSVTLQDNVGASRNLAMTATGGGITQSAGAVTATGTSTLSASGTNAIALTGASNDFGGVVTVSGGATSLHDVNAIAVAGTTSAGTDLTLDATGITFGPGVTTVGGALTANAGTGAIAQSGKVAVTGSSTLTAGGTLTLADSTNIFGGAITATGSSIDIAAASSLNVSSTLGAGGSLTLAANGAGSSLSLGAGTINTSGDVSLTAGAGLSTSGDITAGNVTLGGGTLTIGNHIVASTAFNATSTSTITETGAGDIQAPTATLNAGGNAITLNASTNHLGTVSVTGGAVTISDADALVVHLTNVASASLTAGGTGSLTVDGGTSAGNLTLAGTGIAFGPGATAVHGNLDANSGGGTIAQTGNISVTGTSTLTAGTGAITLTRGGNDFGGLVTANGSAIALTDTNALAAHVVATTSATLAAGGLLTVDGSAPTLAATGNGVVLGAISAGTLQATGGTGTITQTGALAITSATTLATTGQDITLANAANALGTAATTFNGRNVTLVSAGPLSVGGSASGNLTLGGTAVTLGATTVGGALGVAGSGGITGTSPVLVTGASTLNAGSANITLSSTGNHFGGLVTATGGAIALADSGALGVHLASATSANLSAGGALAVDGATTGNLTAGGASVSLGATSVGGALAATASTGAIAQTGAIAVTGTSTLNATAGAITLSNAANDFGGLVTATAGATTSLSDANALSVHLGGSTGATLVAGGALAVDGSTSGPLAASGNGVTFGATTVGGDLAAASGSGAITQTGAIAVSGASTLNAGSNAVTLATASNDFGGTVTATGSTVNLVDATALAAHVTSSGDTTLNAGGTLSVDGTVGGGLAATSTGAMTQAGALTVAGASTLNAGNAAITLTNAGNDFNGAASVTGGAVSLTDANALDVHLSGAGAATLNAGGVLSVDGGSTGALTANGNGVVLGATAVGGNLASTSGGTITQTGAVTVTGTSTLDAGTHAITLASTANDFGGAVTASGSTVSLSDANALTAHLSTTNATLVAGGAVIADGATTGAVTVSATSADIEQAGPLTVHLNNVGSAVVKSNAALHVDGNSAGNVTAGGSAVTLGGSVLTVGGNLAATSTAGDITQAGTLTVTGTSTLAAGGGNVTLADTNNALGGAVTASGTNVTLADASALAAHLAANGSATLTSASGLTVDGSAAALNLTGTSVAFGAAGTTVNGALTTHGGGVSQSGSLTVTGLSTFNAGSGDILLASPGTNLQGAITATGHTISLSDAHAIDATLNASGDVTLSSTADVHAKGTFNGGLKVNGAKVTLDQGTLATPMVIGGKLDVTSSGDTALSYVTANAAQVSAGGAVLLDGTLKSTAGDVTLAGNAIQGVNKLGALDAAAGAKVSLDTSGGSGNIGKATPASNVIDADAIIALLGVTGQSGLSVKLGGNHSAWFRVSSQQQTPLLQPQSTNGSQTFFCDMATCVNILGQSTVIADSVIANILTSASQDAADAAFGTENLDFAIRKGYVTTIGRVPPGIDEIAGDLGATACDSRVTSPTAIAADKACSAGAKAAK